MNNIVMAVASLGGLGLAFGVLLAIASQILKVNRDERIDAISEVLPGANCGGCGFAGCGAFAEAVVGGNGKINGCPVGGKDVAEQVAAIMGKTSGGFVRMVAKVLCMGRDEVATLKYNYMGIRDCLAASKLAGGPKSCEYGCIGLGSCVDVCGYGAIKVVRGVAVVDPEKCTACGKCKAICPKGVIGMTPYDNTVWVLCSSHDKGADVKNKCSIGCIGCKICEKACEHQAISVENCNASIDYEKCTACGECVLKCPKKIIKTDVTLRDLVQEEVDEYKKHRASVGVEQ